MRLYEVNNVEGDDQGSSFFGTKSEAHAAAKKYPKTVWNNIKISEIEVQTDKVGVLAMMNGNPLITETVDAWGLTLRGGLMPWKD